MSEPDTEKSHVSIKPEFSRIIDLARVLADKAELELRASETECKALAGRFGIDSLESFRARLQFRPWRSHGVTVRGRLDARYHQTCVVSLESFAQEMAESITLRLWPREYEARMPREADLIGEGDADSAEPVDLYENNRIDIGELLAECFSVALDDYPRKPDAVPAPDRTADSASLSVDEPLSSPFQKLNRLKNGL
jgi:hypothetical protein